MTSARNVSPANIVRRELESIGGIEKIDPFLNINSRDATEQHVTGSIGAIPQGIADRDSVEYVNGRVIVRREGAK